MPDTPDLINILESFNRKERFFLVAQALGQQDGAGEPAFNLSSDFQQKLYSKVGAPAPEEGERVFVAMDYHLNWVHASLVLAHYTDAEERVDRLDAEAIKRNSEDVDLLVAFKDGTGDYHLIFVEAKGYDTDGLAGFKKSQLNSKVKQRLEEILNGGGVPKYANVKAYYCLASGYEPKNLKSDDWPKWYGEPIKWLELSLPEERLVVKYNASVWKVRKGAKSEQIVPPKGKA